MSALIAPAAAQGMATITDGNGEAATSVTAISHNTTMETSSFTFGCDHFILAVFFSQNDTEAAIGSGAGEAFGTGTEEAVVPCGFGGHGNFFNIVSVSVEQFTITYGSGTGSLILRFDTEIQGNKCHYTGTLPVSYAATTDQFTFKGLVKGESTAGSCFEGLPIQSEFTVLDEWGVPVSIH